MQAWLAALNALGPFEPAPVVAIALSGGADSMALTLLAQAWAQAQGGRVVALTVDHRLRAESTAEAQQVAQWMRAQGIEHHILTPDHVFQGNNLQQAARQWRYDALADWCRAQGVLHCLVAQHADDQHETALLLTERGVTADGGAGMSAVRAYRGVRFLRPLLGVRKAELIACLQARAIPWIEDPSNQRDAFARVRARTRLAGETARRAERRAQLLDQQTERHAREEALAQAAMRCATVHAAGFVTLARDGWLDVPETLRTQLLADAIRTVGGGIHRPRRHETVRLAAALGAVGRHTLGGCTIAADTSHVTITRELARVAAPILLQGTGQLRWDGRFSVQYALDHPLRLAPLGMAGRKLLGTDLPATTPALWHLDDLHAVPHIGWSAGPMPAVRIGFAPAKPLAAQAFW